MPINNLTEEVEPFVDLSPEFEVSKYSSTLPYLVEYYRLRVELNIFRLVRLSTMLINGGS